MAGGVDQEGFYEADRVHGNPFVCGLGSIAIGRPLRRLETVEVRLDLLHWRASVGLFNENDVIRHGVALAVRHDHGVGRVVRSRWIKLAVVGVADVGPGRQKRGASI